MTFPSPSSIRNLLLLPPAIKGQIAQHRKDIQELLLGKKTRFACIVGPCSLHDIGSATEYAMRLYALQRETPHCFLVMRAHVEKPRTHLGWKGILYDPDLDGSGELEQGLFASRKILLSLVEIGIPLAAEFLDPLASLYFFDLISWGFIGARTSSSQIHRQLASHLPMPIGFKNATDGNLESAILGALTAQDSHTFLHMDSEGRICKVQSQGNSSSHVVLRGSLSAPNYTPFWVQQALQLSDHYGLSHRLLIDCSHDNNPTKDPARQKDVVQSVLTQCVLEGNDRIMGLMMESHLYEGKQPFSQPIHPAISLTDPCLSWQDTERLILSLNEALSSFSCASL